MMIKKFRNFKFVIRNCQAGMTYVELIVVLSIFSVMTSIVLFNYNGFQAKVDVKVLANDIALRIVGAQKAAASGQLSTSVFDTTWKPSYGIYFNSLSSTDTDGIPFNEKFIYFTDSNSDNSYDGLDPIIEKFLITKGSFVKDLKCSASSANELNIAFRRPNSDALMSCSTAEIIISSRDSSATATIEVYPSGRIRIK